MERGGVPVAEELMTPGPWTVEVRESMETGSFHYNISNPTYDGPCPCGGKHPPGKLIAWLAGSLRGASDRDRPTEADARAISAVPELLALARIIGSAYPNDPGTSDLDDEQPVTITLGTVRRAWAALAKVDR